LYVVRVEPGVPPNAGLFLSPKIAWSRSLAKVIKKKIQKQKRFNEGDIPLSRQNYVIMGIGVAVIVAGYLAMLQGSVEGFMPLVVSPILLVLGYCVIIPLGILYRKSQPASGSPADSKTEKSQG
jgi:hypothetical protein